MGKRETKKFSGERVGFGVIRSGERQETRKAKSEGWWYFTPKSSTTKTKVIGRVE